MPATSSAAASQPWKQKRDWVVASGASQCAQRACAPAADAGAGMGRAAAVALIGRRSCASRRGGRRHAARDARVELPGARKDDAALERARAGRLQRDRPGRDALHRAMQRERGAPIRERRATGIDEPHAHDAGAISTVGGAELDIDAPAEAVLPLLRLEQAVVGEAAPEGVVVREPRIGRDRGSDHAGVHHEDKAHASHEDLGDRASGRAGHAHAFLLNPLATRSW